MIDLANTTIASDIAVAVTLLAGSACCAGAAMLTAKFLPAVGVSIRQARPSLAICATGTALLAGVLAVLLGAVPGAWFTVASFATSLFGAMCCGMALVASSYTTRSTAAVATVATDRESATPLSRAA